MTDLASPARAHRGHPDTSTIWVMGFLSLFGAFFLGIAAWYFGERLLAKLDAEPERWGRRGWVTAGIAMGKVGICLSVLWFFLLRLGS